MTRMLLTAFPLVEHVYSEDCWCVPKLLQRAVVTFGITHSVWDHRPERAN